MKKNSIAIGPWRAKARARKRRFTIGMDLGDRTSRYCMLDEQGEVVLEGSLATTKKGLDQVFGRLPRCRVALEVGTHSPWVSRQLKGMSHEVIVANARRVRLIVESSRKDDRLDARTLARLKQVSGVGTLIALTYVLTLEDPLRFRRSRDAGCYVGLRPKRRNSGDSNPQLRITKEGDRYWRKLLVQGAHYILGPFGPDCDLRRWGLKLAARGGKNAKKRARVAVARKLAVLLHKLWVSGEAYEPLRHSLPQRQAAA